jgi:CelD/BcsL family acetyltransferase involved in cellulose biosynthesis
MLTHRPSIGPLRVRVLQFFGADVNLTEVRGLVCRPQDQGDVIALLTHCFLERANDWDWLDWSCIRDVGATRHRLAQSGAIDRDDLIPSYHLLALPATWEELRASRPRNIKESLRKCYNSLKRAGLSFVFRVVECPDETPSALDIFFELHAQRARAVGTVEHPDVFAAPRERAFLAEYARCMAKRGQLRIFQLEIAGKVVATRVGFVFGDELYLYYSGYDMSWAKFSVMTTLVAESLKWAVNQRLKIVNLSAGRDVSKDRWDPKAVTFCSAVQIAPTRRASVAFRAYHAATRLRQKDSRLARLLAR